MNDETKRPRNGKGSMFPRDKPIVSIVIRMTEEDMDKLAKLAQREDRTPGAQARHLVRKGLEDVE